MIQVETTRFGTISVAETEVLDFPSGLVGFPELRRYTLVPHPTGGPFVWLQSLEQPALAFVVTDPALFFADYKIEIRKEEIAELELENAADSTILVLVTIARDPHESTANLLGPVVVNRRNRRARQIVLGDGPFTTRHRLFPAQEERCSS